MSDLRTCVSLGSAKLAVVAKAYSRHPSYLNDLWFEVLAGKLQCWKSTGVCDLLEILLLHVGGAGEFSPPELKQGAQIQNVLSHDAFKRPFKMCVATGGLFAVLWGKEFLFQISFGYLLFLIVLYLAFLCSLLKYNSGFKKKKKTKTLP